MPSRLTVQPVIFLVLLVLIVPVAAAQKIPDNEIIDTALKTFVDIKLGDQILDAARNLFWTLATVSLVWTMGMLIVRQDIGEMLMELLRFVLVTGIFFWFLDNASDHDGGGDFVSDILLSFFQMSNDSPSNESFRTNAAGLLSRGLSVYYRVIAETHGADPEDQLLTGGMAILILIVSALMAAQFLVALVMAWMLSYAGIFLLGFGGARWTSPIAVSYYKHVLAMGVALLSLSFVGVAASNFMATYDVANLGSTRSPGQYAPLGGMLAVVILMMVLSIKIPQLFYALVTGSPLGLFMGTATMAGHAIASGGSAAWASAMNALPNGGGSPTRADSVMDAVQRSASVAGGMSDPFHVTSGSDAFGIARNADPYRQSRGGSVFSGTQAAEAAAVPSSPDLGRMHTPSSPAKTTHVRPTSSAATQFANEAESSVARVESTTDQREITAPEGEGEGVAFASAGAIARPDYDAELGVIETSRSEKTTVKSSPTGGQSDGWQETDDSVSVVLPLRDDVTAGELNRDDRSGTSVLATASEGDASTTPDGASKRGVTYSVDGVAMDQMQTDITADDLGASAHAIKPASLETATIDNAAMKDTTDIEADHRAADLTELRGSQASLSSLSIADDASPTSARIGEEVRMAEPGSEAMIEPVSLSVPQFATAEVPSSTEVQITSVSSLSGDTAIHAADAVSSRLPTGVAVEDGTARFDARVLEVSQNDRSGAGDEGAASAQGRLVMGEAIGVAADVVESTATNSSGPSKDEGLVRMVAVEPDAKFPGDTVSPSITSTSDIAAPSVGGIPPNEVSAPSTMPSNHGTSAIHVSGMADTAPANVLDSDGATGDESHNPGTQDVLIAIESISEARDVTLTETTISRAEITDAGRGVRFGDETTEGKNPPIAERMEQGSQSGNPAPPVDDIPPKDAE